MRTGAVGVVLLAAVCVLVCRAGEKQTVVLETQEQFFKEEDDSQEKLERPANGQTAGQWMGIMKRQRTLRLRAIKRKSPNAGTENPIYPRLRRGSRTGRL